MDAVAGRFLHNVHDLQQGRAGPGQTVPNHEPVPNGRAPRIVVAHDEPLLRACVDTILRAENYRVFAAPGAADALRHLHAHGADLLLLDLRLPPVAGFKLVECLRTDRALAHIPIILFTSARDEVRGNRLGVFDCIARAVGRDELLERVFRGVCLSAMNPRS